jgi:hypothetical protein
VHVTVHRPGQVVALDTTPLPVKVRDGVFGEPVSAHLTLALDVFTHSAVAFRLTLVSEWTATAEGILEKVSRGRVALASIPANNETPH